MPVWLVPRFGLSLTDGRCGFQILRSVIRNTSTQRQQVNPRRLQEIHLLALRASKFSSFKQ